MKSHLFTYITVAMGIILFSSTASVVEDRSKQLATPLVGGDFFSGIMFDVDARHDMELTGIAFHTSATTSIDMSVYTRDGSFEGNEMDESEWTLVETKNVDGQGGGSATYFSFDAPMKLLLEGETRAFYMFTQAGPFLRTSTTSETDLLAGDEAYSNEDIEVHVGVGKKRGWQGAVRRTTIFEGMLSYDLYFFPSASPTESPTLSPTSTPSNVPSSSPIETPSMAPSISAQPSASPTASPSSSPSFSPSNLPTDVPTVSAAPSSSPTSSPSSLPSTVPTVSSMPSATPSASPSDVPSISSMPSATPTLTPFDSPSASPSAFPTMNLNGLTIRSSVFTAVKDTYIEIGSNETFGNELFVDKNPHFVTLIKFDISSLNGGTDEEPLTVYDAKLRLHALSDSEFGGSVSIYHNLDFDEEGANSDSDGSWAELTETYHVGEFGRVSQGKSYTLDILDAFRKKPLPPTFSVRITSDSSDGVRYRSREGPNGASEEKFGPKVIFDFAYEPATHIRLAETFGTDAPTLAPTITKTWADNPVPTNPPSRYFNYDPSSDYGPENWRRRTGTTDWDKWNNLKTDHTTNKCGSGTRQSPRDLCGDRTRTSCYETHQIRRASVSIHVFAHSFVLDRDFFFHRQQLTLTFV